MSDNPNPNPNPSPNPNPNPNPSNMGSAKLLSFGVLAGLSKDETLALFGSYE